MKKTRVRTLLKVISQPHALDGDDAARQPVHSCGHLPKRPLPDLAQALVARRRRVLMAGPESLGRRLAGLPHTVGGQISLFCF